jgi:hypothetical protein
MTRDQYEKQKLLWERAMQNYDQQKELENVSLERYQRGLGREQELLDIEDERNAWLREAERQQYGLTMGMQGTMLDAAGMDQYGQLNEYGQQLKGRREGLANLSAAYKGLDEYGNPLSDEDMLGRLSEQDARRYEMGSSAYDQLTAAQNAKPGEYLGSTAVEYSIDEANRLAKEQGARFGRKVGSSANAQMQSKLMKQGAIARDEAQKSAMSTYAGLAGQYEETLRAREAAVSQGFGDIQQSTTAGLEHIPGISNMGKGYTPGQGNVQLDVEDPRLANYATGQDVMPGVDLMAPTQDYLGSIANTMTQFEQNRYSNEYLARNQEWEFKMRDLQNEFDKEQIWEQERAQEAFLNAQRNSGLFSQESDDGGGGAPWGAIGTAAGGIIGSFFGQPGMGAQIGGGLGNLVGSFTNDSPDPSSQNPSYGNSYANPYNYSEGGGFYSNYPGGLASIYGAY